MRFFSRALLVVVVGFIVIQLVPYGCDHSNPPGVTEPDWDTPRTRELFMRACGDCHSHETKWPWYTSVAPARWLAYRDVVHGREHLNLSAWGQGKQEADEVGEVIEDGEMPPWFYLPLHSEADLTGAEKKELIDGLAKTLGTNSSAESHDDDDD
jgi:mono/diheme cytochrome c family protein